MVELDCVNAAKIVQGISKSRYGERPFYNVSWQQQEGIQSLVRKRGDGLVYFQTDKSGKMAADSLSNFKEKMADHVACGSEVEHEDVLQIERELNERAKSWSLHIPVGRTSEQRHH